jgi:uncharacterized membrane protein
MVVSAVVLFALTYRIDRWVDATGKALPGWVSSGGADAARQLLIGSAAMVITVAGVVFSVTILVLQLASQQFGPRMLRNFIRDRGTQISLGAFVATFTYSILTLVAVGDLPSGEFVPHVSITVAMALTLADLGVLIYFIHHVATSIQLTSVVAGIARDFRSTLDATLDEARTAGSTRSDPTSQLALATSRLEQAGQVVLSRGSGFLQAVGHDRLVQIATGSSAIIRLLLRPGNFIVDSQPLAVVWPAEAATDVSVALTREHIVGPSRTLTQDLGFAVDQLVEVAIRALSPAVNDTFTALNCIDWLGDCLCRAARQPLPDGLYRDAAGELRLIEPTITFERLVKRASDKIRQAGHGMPAVLIRLLENLQKLGKALTEPSQRESALRQAEMILRAGEDSVVEPSDRDDIRRAHDRAVEALGEPVVALER